MTEPRAVGLDRIVDIRLSLAWLITTASTVVCSIAALAWQVSAGNSDLRQVAREVSRIERRLDTRDDRIDQLRDDLQALRAAGDLRSQRLAAAEERLRAVAGR